MTSSRIDLVNFRNVLSRVLQPGIRSRHIRRRQVPSNAIGSSGHRVIGSGEVVEGFEVGAHGVAAGVHQAQAAIGLDAADAGDGRGCKR